MKNAASFYSVSMKISEELEEELCAAIDLYAEGRESDAELTYEKIEHAAGVALADDPEDRELIMLLAQIRILQEEYQQALLRYEQVLQLDPDDTSTLWVMVTLLMEQLENPQVALTLLEEKLIPMNPEERDYRNAVISCRRAIAVEESEQEFTAEAL